MSENIIDLFNTAQFRCLLLNVQNHQLKLKSIALAFLHGMDASRNAVKGWFKDEASHVVDNEVESKIVKSLDRVEKLMRFFACIFCLNVDVAGKQMNFKFNPSSDMMWLLSFTGSQALEKNISEILQTGAWPKLVDEVVRTATTSVSLRPVRDRAVETLQWLGDGTVFSIAPERLGELVELVKKLNDGMRRSEAEKFMSLFQDVLMRSSEQLQSGKIAVCTAGSKAIQMLAMGLKALAFMPGTTDEANKLESWMTKNTQAMAWSDFQDLAEDSHGKGVVPDLQVLSAVMVKLHKIAVPDDSEAVVACAKSLVVTAFRAVIAEAGLVLLASLQFSGLSSYFNVIMITG